MKSIKSNNDKKLCYRLLSIFDISWSVSMKNINYNRFYWVSKLSICNALDYSNTLQCITLNSIFFSSYLRHTWLTQWLRILPTKHQKSLLSCISRSSRSKCCIEGVISLQCKTIVTYHEPRNTPSKDLNRSR